MEQPWFLCCVDGKLGQDNVVDPGAAVFVSEDLFFFFPRKSDATVTEYGKSPASPSCLYSGVGTHVLISHPELRHDGA